MSSHADQTGLLDWINAYTRRPEKLILVHGDDEAMTAFSALVREKTGLEPICPYSGSVFDLASGEFTHMAEPRFIKRETGVSVRNTKVQQELTIALSELTRLAEEYREGANSDIRRLTKDIRSLLDKWKE